MTTEERIKTIGVLGGEGFLGSQLVEFFSKQGMKAQAIGKGNYKDLTGAEFDILVNANGNSKKFWANQNPQADFEASVKSVENSIKDFHFQKYIYISSSDAYPDHHDPELSIESAVIDRSRLEAYGLHKLMAEDLVSQLTDFVILRCSAMVGPGLKKGAVKDILDQSPLFITSDSRLQFISTLAIGSVIEKIIQLNIRREVFNCGGKGSVSPEEIAGVLGLKAAYRPDAKQQIYEMSVAKLNKIFPLGTSLDYVRSQRPG
jgi:nucleoside-diphosphate-sugar epimerase